MGEDPVAVCRYLGERDRISHVHFRNVVVRLDRERGVIRNQYAGG